MIAVSGFTPLAEQELFQQLNGNSIIAVSLMFQVENHFNNGWIFVSSSWSQSKAFKMHSINGKMYDMIVNAPVDLYKTFTAEYFCGDNTNTNFGIALHWG